ncbi:hypothetical protein [Flavobacterium sp. I3-2]|uniref:hypothetical protein n=1 Tax=Flavobacterium sp. I3-2 TaxID=2748319 RepID=UPI0015AF86AD|nr:hypothetical protein [Flavobacterium sp. I3-2]
MKTVISTLFLLLVVLTTQAQEVNQIPIKQIPAKYIQIQIIPRTLFEKAYVSVDYGQLEERFSNKEFKNKTMLKRDNSEMEFFSYLALLNFFYDNGFKLIESYQDISTNVDHEVTANSRKYLLENLNYQN